MGVYLGLAFICNIFAEMVRLFGSGISSSKYGKAKQKNNVFPVTDRPQV